MALANADSAESPAEACGLDPTSQREQLVSSPAAATNRCRKTMAWMAEWAIAPVCYLLGIFSGVLAILSTVLLVEVAAAVPSRRGQAFPLPTGNRPRAAVLVPAHNESAGLLPTLYAIQAQLRATDRLLVVADNCSDDTAAVALAAGAEVVERNDPSRIGKGYALDWGIRHLRADPPAVVIVIDADCRVSDSALATLATVCENANRPIQALYLMTAPACSSISYRISEFAWRLKNWARPLGLESLGLPCQLMGTGMASPWDVIRTADLASGHIVEDLKLGLDLADGGWPPLFCPSAVVMSEFPQSATGVTSQRERWEHGHLSMIALAPALIARNPAPQLAAIGPDARHGSAAAGSARAADDSGCCRRGSRCCAWALACTILHQLRRAP